MSVCSARQQLMKQGASQPLEAGTGTKLDAKNVYIIGRHRYTFVGRSL